MMDEMNYSDIDDDDFDVTPMPIMTASKPKVGELRLELLQKCRVKQQITKEEALSYSDYGQDEEEQPIIDMIYTTKVEVRYEETQKYINEFKSMEFIGKGAYSKVKHAVRQFMKEGELKEEDYALKIMHKPTLKREKGATYTKEGDLIMSDCLDKVFTEINVWGRAKHPNVVHLFEIIEQPSDDYLYVVLDLGELGQIADWVNDERIYTRSKKVHNFIIEKYLKDKEFENEDEKIEAVAKIIFKDALQGLEYLHSKNFIHRDIKLENILIGSSDGKAKLSDFSVSGEIENDDELMRNSEGTPSFMAPEIQTSQEDGFKAKPTDIWSMGITIYAYISSKTPFWGDNEYAIPNKAETEEAPKLENISDELNDLIQKMILKNPDDRPTASECLKHEWFLD